jgi:tetratricopeptide (TPR) repeat protein
MLAKAYTALRRFDDAHTQLRDAMQASRQTSDLVGQGYAMEYTAHVFQLQGRYPDAIDHHSRAFDLYGAAGERALQANPLNGIGLAHVRLGNHRQALRYCEPALALQQEFGDRSEEAATWASLGHARSGLGDYTGSAICYRQALDVFRDTGDRYREAFVLASMGDTQHAAGDPAAAERTWRQALDIFDQLNHADAEKVRAKLSAIT